MSINENRKSKIIIGLAAFGLLIGVYVPRASALDASNYKGRYGCSVQAFDPAVGLGDFRTAIIRYRPNGSGAYDKGDLVASLTAFASFPTVSPTGDYCVYALNPAASSYTIGSDGTGFEVLSWVASTANNAACPSD